jgi:TolB protein
MRLFSVTVALCGTMLAFGAAPIPQNAKPEMLIVSNRTGNAEIFLTYADGSDAKNLTLSKCQNSFPAWSPDGKKIAFASDFDGTMNIYLMDANGNNTKQLTKSKEPTWHPSWSPDGKQIVFSRKINNAPVTYLLDVNGGNEKLIMENAADPTWSPDGSKILLHPTAAAPASAFMSWR